jgi:hypothetical protein
MIREIVKPAGSTYTLNLPDEMIGKTVEVIAFEIENEKQKNIIKKTIGQLKNEPEDTASNTIKDLQDIRKRYSRYPLISHDGYKFDRDEANNYE